MPRTRNKAYQPPTIHELNQQLIQKKRVEKIILFSSIIIIGYIYVWILAIYWIRTYKDKPLRMLAMWRQNPLFQGSFPFLPGYHPTLTNQKAYYDKIRQAEMIKSILMYTLAIPFVGYVLIIAFSFATLGVLPLIIYYVTTGPSRYAKQMQRQLSYQARTQARGPQTPNTRYPSQPIPPPQRPAPPTPVPPSPARSAQTTKPASHAKTSEEIIHSPTQVPTTKSSKPTITKVTEPFFCQVCEAARPATMQRMKCETCSRYVCFDCFTQMVNVGKTDCPMCEGRLYSQ
jgi:hypothetical protein